jgi:hypothetical protein
MAQAGRIDLKGGVGVNEGGVFLPVMQAWQNPFVDDDCQREHIEIQRRHGIGINRKSAV